MIVAAARDAFAEHGYHGVSTARIAEAADCSEAVLYRHFPSKKAILLAVYDSMLDRAGEMLSGALVSRPPERALVSLVEAAVADPEFTKLLRNFVLALSMSDEPGVESRLLANFDGIRERARGLVRHAQESGALREDIDPETVVWLWHGLVVTAGLRHSVRADGIAEGAAEAAEALLSLLAPPE